MVGFTGLCIPSMYFQHLEDGISELREASFLWICDPKGSAGKMTNFHWATLY